MARPATIGIEQNLRVVDPAWGAPRFVGSDRLVCAGRRLRKVLRHEERLHKTVLPAVEMCGLSTIRMEWPGNSAIKVVGRRFES